jgi:hypothetical protein
VLLEGEPHTECADHQGVSIQAIQTHTHTHTMNTETTRQVHLPPGWSGLPVVLTAKEVVTLTEFWNLGGRYYFEELRECQVIRSVNKFPSGKRARYSSAELVEKVYPVKGRS